MGKGVPRDDHPLVLGMTGFWGTRLVNDACLAADVILAIGTRFKEADSSSWYRGFTFDIPPTALLHVDIEPPRSAAPSPPRSAPSPTPAPRWTRAATGWPASSTPEAFARPGVRAHPPPSGPVFAAANAAMATSDAFPMMPERILADVRAELPDDAYLTTDVGWNKNGVGQQFPSAPRAPLLTPGGFATMGFGPSAAIGAKLAAPRPDRGGRCWATAAFGPETGAARHRGRARPWGIVWVVMNNNAFGTIAGLQEGALRADLRHDVPR
jgi:acetolactate synthase-1/2/3 large subunit